MVQGLEASGQGVSNGPISLAHVAHGNGGGGNDGSGVEDSRGEGVRARVGVAME